MMKRAAIPLAWLTATAGGKHTNTLLQFNPEPTSALKRPCYTQSSSFISITHVSCNIPYTIFQQFDGVKVVLECFVSQVYMVLLFFMVLHVRTVGHVIFPI